MLVEIPLERREMATIPKSSKSPYPSEAPAAHDCLHISGLGGLGQGSGFSYLRPKLSEADRLPLRNPKP